MSAISKIEWTDRTWNPIRGCSIVSPGCVNCYAMKFAHRFNRPGGPYEGLTKATSAGPQWTGQVRFVESALREPLSWRQPARVFVNSMSDLFHESVPDAFLDQVFAMMAVTPQHTYQVLTKRPERMCAYLTALPGRNFNAAFIKPTVVYRLPLPNVWLGVSCEDQQRADERIPILLQAPATVRFISAEPLLGPIDLDRVRIPRGLAECNGGELPPLNWVIVGGESGPKARPCDIEWIRSIVGQCKVPGVPVFVKQLGALPVGSTEDIPQRESVSRSDRPMIGFRDRKGGDPAEWPDDLRVREFPRECDALAALKEMR